MRELLDRLRGKKSTVIPDDLWAAIVTSLPFLDVLPADEQKQLKRLAEGFLAEKEFSTAGGLELSDEICVSIAAQGCLPILKLGLNAYHDWIGIVVYPNEFVVPRRIEDESGIVHEYADVLSGEAWAGGPLIVSWHDVQMAGDGYNVVIHEFAHQLDQENGAARGAPPPTLGDTRHDAKRWSQVFHAAYARLQSEARHGVDGLLNHYGAQDPAEFFAVVSEVFFEQPQALAAEYPSLYQELSGYYKVDPAGW